MKTFLVPFIFWSVITLCYSQTGGVVSYYKPNVYVEKGDYYFDKKDFKKAIVYYNMAFAKDANYYSVLRKAEAYTSLKYFTEAAECYRIVLHSDYQASNEYLLKYAYLLLKTGNIKGFETWMGRYNENIRSEINDKTSAKKSIAELYTDSVVVIVENEGVLNSPESEICPAVYKNKVCFASNRKNLTGSKANDYYNLFSASYVQGANLGKLNIYNNSLNSKQNESSAFFPGNTNNMYFTRSAPTGENLEAVDLKSYVTSISNSPNDKLTVNEFKIEGAGNIGQVSFNNNGSKIYFVSDAPGGSGGLDIYTSDLINGKWGAPKNLGTNINTTKDEMYPFILNDSILYFTSDGLNGMGGLDLYSVNIKRENSKPKNLGSKVNSKYDDFCLTFSVGGLTGYFSSNRPGGFGKEDIYRLHLLNYKVKKPVFQFKSAPTIEDKKINLYLSDGSDYNIASDNNAGFDFSFQPQELYKMVIQHEDPLATNVLNNDKLSAEQKTKAFLNPIPFEKTDIDLEPGMRYQFTVGMKPISDDYKKALNDLSANYQSAKTSTIDLTALAKELLLKDGEIYTIRFVKDKNQPTENKSEEVSSLFVNDKTVDVSGKSFFIVLPLDIQTSFNVKTDIDYFKEKFNPKKTGSVKVDTEMIIKEKPVKLTNGFPILVNTQSFVEAENVIEAKELSIIPGTFYLFSLIKSYRGTDEKLEIFIPLTKGVKYNISKEVPSGNEFNKELAQMMSTTPKEQAGEERIDISILSKELDISPDDSIMFSLTPVKPKGSNIPEPRNIFTILDIDGMNYFVKTNQKMKVHLKFEQDKKINIQTDLSYVKENFEPSTIELKVDNSSLSKNVEEESKKIITDPVFDVIVINFNINEYTIRNEAKTILDDKVVKILNDNSNLYVTIKGYTDPLGDADYNEKLSKNRAQAVKDYLANSSVGENRIRTFSFGETQSLKEGVNWEDLSEAELQKHRKVEIVMYLPK